MSNQRYYAQDQRGYGPCDNHRFAARGRSPPYRGGDRYGRGAYSGAPPEGPRDYSRFDETRDRVVPPRGPRGRGSDAPRGRGDYVTASTRGGKFSARDDVRGDRRGSFRDAYQDVEILRDQRGADTWDDRDRTWREQEPLTRRESPPPLPRGPSGARDFRGQEARDIEYGRGRGYDDTRFRGRGRGRPDWMGRGRGRGNFQDDRPHLTRSRSPRPVQWAMSDRPRSRSPIQPRADRQFERRRSQDAPVGQVFDPYSQARAAALDSARPSIPQPARTVNPPPPQAIDAATNRSTAFSHGSENTDYRRTQSNQRRGAASGLEARRISLQPDKSHGGQSPACDVPLPSTSSPPRPPQVPAFGSLPTLKAPLGPKAASNDATAARPPSTAPTAPKGSRLGVAIPHALKIETDRPTPTGPRTGRAQDVSVFPENKVSAPTNIREQNFGTNALNPSQQQQQQISTVRTSSSAQSRGPSASYQSQTSVHPPPPPPPPAAPLGPRAFTSPVTSHSNVISVPTGPKASRVPPIAPPRAPTGPSAPPAWPRPWIAGMSAGPKLASMVPVKRDVQGAEKSRDMSFHAAYQPPQVSQGETYRSSQHQARLPHDNLDATVHAPTKIKSTPQSPAWGDEPPDFGLNPSSEMPTESDSLMVDGFRGSNVNGPPEVSEELMDLDEADFQEKEEQFLRDKARLEAEKLDPTSEDLRCDAMLEEFALLLQLSILSLPAPDEPPPLSVDDDDSDTKILPSTPEAPEPTDIDTSGKYKEDFALVPISDAELDSLPFLFRGPQVPLDDIEGVKENIGRHAKLRPSLINHETSIRRERSDEEREIREEYRELYLAWADGAEQLDSEPREEILESDEPLQPTPLLDANPLTVVSAGGRRGLVTGVESEFERALQESLQTANQEEKRRKKLESSAKFDAGKEVHVPGLLNDEDQLRMSFWDTRCLCEDRDLRVEYGLEPEPDDFTDGEHNKMVDGFTQYPKKWGTLARELGGQRTYKDCIRHYYSSKWAGDFKDRRDKRRPRQRNGRLRTSQIQPKSNRLISNLGDPRNDFYDGDEYSVSIMAVTDSGRPRRAAAPNFGVKESDELSTLTPSTSKKMQKVGLPQDSGLEKPSRRPRLPNKEKSQRKARPLQMLRGGSASPEKVDFEGSVSRPMESFDPRAVDPTVHMHQPCPPSITHESVFAYDQIPATHTAGRDYGVDDINRHASQSRRSNMSSYWSVNEINNFFALIHECGSDWQTISQKLGSKTAVMAKNYYKRAVEKNTNPGIEEALRLADERRSQVDPQTGPSPLVLSPMGHDTTNSRNFDRRALAPSAELVQAPASQPSFVDAPRIDTSCYDRDSGESFATDFDGRRAHREQEVPQYTFMQSGSIPRLHPHRVFPNLSYADTGFPGALKTNLESPSKVSTTPNQLVSSWNGSKTMLNESSAPPTTSDRMQSIYASRHMATEPADRPSMDIFAPRFPHSYVSRERERNLSRFERDTPAGRPDGPERSERASAIDENVSRPWSFPTTNMSPIRDRPPSAPLAPPPATSREPRKQSNLASLLNAEPESPRAPPAPSGPPRSQTPSYANFLMDRQSVQLFPQPERREVIDLTQHNRYSTTPRNHSTIVDDHRSQANDQARGTPDWASRINTFGPPSRNFPAGVEDLGPLEHHRADLIASYGRHNPSPDPSLGFGRPNQDRLQPGSLWSTHPEQSSLGGDPRHPEAQQLHDNDQRFSSFRDRWPTHVPGDEQERDAEKLHPQDRPPVRRAPTLRGDDFLMNGSGTYRSLSAQRDNHNAHLANQQHQNQIQQHAQDESRVEREINPFRHSESQPHDLRAAHEAFRSSSTIGRPGEDRRPLRFGRLGPQDQPALREHDDPHQPKR